MPEQLFILDIIEKTDLNNDESIVEAASAIYNEQLTFTTSDGRLVGMPEEEYKHLEVLSSINTFDHYDIGLSNLKEKFSKDVGELLFYCARIGVGVR